MELVGELLSINLIIEDTLGLWHRGELHITNAGWDRSLFPEDEKTYWKMLERWSVDDVLNSQEHLKLPEITTDNFKIEDVEKSNDELIALLDRVETSELVKGDELGDELELIKEINPIYEHIFGYKLTSKLKGLTGLLFHPIKSRRLWFCEDELVKFFCGRFGWSEEQSIKILNSLSLDGESIRLEGSQPFEYNRLSRISRKPVPKIIYKDMNMYFLSFPTMQRGFENLVFEYASNTHPELLETQASDVANQVLSKHGDWFTRERILPIIQKANLPADFNIKMVGKLNVEKECGEIDILCYIASCHKICVIECKHKSLKQVNINQFRNSVTDYIRPKGFVKTLSRKVAWVSNHSTEVLNYLGIKGDNVPVTTFGLFVTNYYTPAVEFVKEFEIVIERDLAEWCERQLKQTSD
jgi:hypothetical protein